MADFKSKYISELEKGKGVFGGAKGAASSSMEDFKKQFSKEGLAKKAFGGDDILSALIRGKMGIKKEKGGKSPSKEGVGGGLGEDATSVLSIIAKNSMSLPGMARDMNVLRQNIVKLVKLKGGKTSRFGGKADAFFKGSKEREETLEAQMASKRKVPSKSTSPARVATEGSGESIFSIIIRGIVQAGRFLFNPKNLLRIIGRLGPIALIIAALFSGIKAGFEKYQETGSFKEAIISYFGGMLEFVTFGLLGDDAVRSHLDFLQSLFTPVLDTVSNIFDSIKGFFKGIFGSSVDVDGIASKTGSPKSVDASSKDSGKIGGPGGEADKAGANVTAKATEMGLPEGTIPKGIFGDMGNVIDAGNSGGFGAMISAGEELKKKYPQKAGPAGETSNEQASRNYELNKNLTSKVSGAIGIDLPMPAPPSPVMGSATAAAGGSSGTAPLPVAKDKPAPDLAPAGSAGAPTPAAAPAPAPSPTAASSGDSYADKAETNRIGALQFLKRSLGIMPPDPRKPGTGYTDMRNGDKPLSEEEVRKRISAAGKDPNKIISLLNDTGKGGGSIDLSSGNLNTITGGAIGGGAGTAPPASSTAPAPMTGAPPVSGASLSSASTEVAEAQRMESAADQGSVVNAPTNNNSSSSSGKPSKQTASAYDSDFAQRLATT